MLASEMVGKVGEMRLYRAKRLDSREWIEGSLIVHDGLHFIETGSRGWAYNRMSRSTSTYFSRGIHKVDPATVSQQTGLKDKKGVEIYENMDVRAPWQCRRTATVTGKVVYYPKYALYALEDDEGKMWSPVWDESEVIHDNSELIND